jgi:hypothetical protein
MHNTDLVWLHLRCVSTMCHYLPAEFSLVIEQGTSEGEFMVHLQRALAISVQSLFPSFRRVGQGPALVDIQGCR